MGGLAFRYIPPREELDAFHRLDILTRDSLFSMEGISLKNIISDEEFSEEYPHNYRLRRRGVQFAELTSSQMADLQYLIEHHTVGRV
jgi:hypothetical protein